MKDINRIRVRAGLPEKNLSGKDAIMTELQKTEIAGICRREYTLG